MKRFLPVVGLWVVLVTGSVPMRRFHEGIEPPKATTRFEDVLLDLLGEGRTMLARLLWFKMDMMHEQLDDDGVAAFAQTQLVPLMRMVTFLDPTIVDAYDTLAFELYHGHHKTDQAIEIVDEGLQFNKQSFELNWRRGLLAEKKADYTTALVYANDAYQVSGDDYVKKLSALRSIYRLAVHAKDAYMGVQVVDRIRTIAPDTRLYDAQYSRWKAEIAAAERRALTPPR